MRLRFLLLYFLAPIRHRSVFSQFVKREILSRYRGSLFGLAWAFVTPLLMLGVYTFVFVGVFKARWPGMEASGGEGFALSLFAGLVVFNLFAEVVGRSPSLILEQPNLVKKVAFPVELLPFVALGSALFHCALNLLMLVAGILIFRGEFHATVLLSPIILLPMIPLLMGIGWFLSAIGVFFRDIGPATSLLVSLLMFMSPVFYATQSIDPKWQFWLGINPLTPVIENLRGLAFAGVLPGWTAWGGSLLVCAGVAAIGASVFHLSRQGFADVL